MKFYCFALAALSTQALQLHDDINFDDDLFLQIAQAEAPGQATPELQSKGVWKELVPGKAPLDYTDAERAAKSANVQGHLSG